MNANCLLLGGGFMRNLNVPYLCAFVCFQTLYSDKCFYTQKGTT